jgi:hypothetical protein
VSGFGICSGIIAICILPVYLIYANNLNGSNEYGNLKDNRN